MKSIDRSRGSRTRARRLTPPIAALLAACALALSACGDTLQDQPVAHNTLESLIVAPYPVYWLGSAFHGLQITAATHDPGGAFSVQYGNCVEGGQSTCVPALRVVTSPDNSFVPGGSTPQHSTSLRGVSAVVAQRGRTLAIPTGGVVIALYADSAPLASAAAQTLVPINQVAQPGAPLPKRLPDTGFGSTPLPSQVPSPLRAFG
jgi:hypothetical protein